MSELQNQEQHIRARETTPEEHEHVITVRKRKWRSSMSDGSVDQFLSELYNLRDQRNISPMTATKIDILIRRYNEIDVSEKGTPGWAEKSKLIHRLKDGLEAYLEKDEKHWESLQKFRQMLCDTLLLRYGDYLKHNLKHLKDECATRYKQEELGSDFLRGKTWKAVLESIDQEKTDLEAWRARKDEAKARKESFEEQPPTTTITNYLNELAMMCKWSFEHAVFEIREYQLRNETAHSGLDLATRALDLPLMADYILRDRRKIEHGILPEGMQHVRDALIDALNVFQERYFDYIIPEEDPEAPAIGGMVLERVYKFKISKSLAEKEAKKIQDDLKNASLEQLAKEIEQQLSLDSTEDFEQELKDTLRDADYHMQKVEDEFKRLQVKLNDARQSRKAALSELKRHRLYLEKERERDLQEKQAEGDDEMECKFCIGDCDGFK
jgi:hypothetical protein